MSIQDQIAQKKVELADLEAQLVTAMPHLSVLAEIAAFGERIDQNLRAEFDQLVEKAKNLF